MQEKIITLLTIKNIVILIMAAFLAYMIATGDRTNFPQIFDLFSKMVEQAPAAAVNPEFRIAGSTQA